MSKALFSESIAEYIDSHACSKTPKLLKEIYGKAMKDEKAGYNTPLSQLQLIYMLCKIANPQKILEVGVFRGLGSIAMCLGSSDTAKLTLLDITDQYLLDYKDYWARAGLNAKSNLMIGRAEDSLKQLIANGESKTYDFAYIDANKSDYPIYYELVLQLSKSGGIILIDNVLWKGEVVNCLSQNKPTKSIQILNEIVKKDTEVESIIIPIQDGLYFLRKR